MHVRIQFLYLYNHVWYITDCLFSNIIIGAVTVTVVVIIIIIIISEVWMVGCCLGEVTKQWYMLSICKSRVGLAVIEHYSNTILSFT